MSKKAVNSQTRSIPWSWAQRSPHSKGCSAANSPQGQRRCPAAPGSTQQMTAPSNPSRQQQLPPAAHGVILPRESQPPVLAQTGPLTNWEILARAAASPRSNPSHQRQALMLPVAKSHWEDTKVLKQFSFCKRKLLTFLFIFYHTKGHEIACQPKHPGFMEPKFTFYSGV